MWPSGLRRQSLRTLYTAALMGVGSTPAKIKTFFKFVVFYDFFTVSVRNVMQLTASVYCVTLVTVINVLNAYFE